MFRTGILAALLAALAARAQVGQLCADFGEVCGAVGSTSYCSPSTICGGPGAKCSSQADCVTGTTCYAVEGGNTFCGTTTGTARDQRGQSCNGAPYGSICEVVESLVSTCNFPDSSIAGQGICGGLDSICLSSSGVECDFGLICSTTEDANTCENANDPVFSPAPSQKVRQKERRAKLAIKFPQIKKD